MVDSTQSGRSPRQLSLGIQLDDDATFENFFIAPDRANAQVIEVLTRQLSAAGEQTVFLWGGVGVGISHLLQAACHHAEVQGGSAQYLPLAELQAAEPAALLEGLESLDLVCLDDLQEVLGRADWERALFHFFNLMRDSGRRVLMGARNSPRQLPVALADLQSRLNWGLVYQVQPLDDDSKCAALQARASDLGLELSPEVARFILSRSARDSQKLFAALRLLDRVSLEEQRRLTIPFVKRVLGV